MTTRNEALFAAIAEEKERNRRLRACDLDAWYDRLADFTYRTVFVALEQDEARAMVAAYAAQQAKKYTNRSNNEVVDNNNVDDGVDVPEALASLEQRLGDAMARSELGGGRGVFAKLSSRSPKDSTLCEARALAAVCEMLSAKQQAKTKELDSNNNNNNAQSVGELLSTNTVFRAVFQAGIAALRLESAREVLQCFLTSDR